MEERLIKFFKWDHLPPHLQEVSKSFADLAITIVAKVPAGPERTLALRALWESKNLAVAAVAIPL